MSYGSESRRTARDLAFRTHRGARERGGARFHARRREFTPTIKP
jgi:hypothetical protein